MRVVRDAGVGIDRWFGDLPVGWRSAAVRRLFQIVNGSTPSSSEERFWGGPITWITPNDLGQLEVRVIRESHRTLTEEGYRSCGTTLVPPGSLILSTRAPIGHIAVAGIPLCTNQGCRSLVPRIELDTRYYYYCLLAARKPLQALGQGSTFQELGTADLASFRVPLPPTTAQRAIADFLDEKTAAIDALIAKKERLIALLEERYQARVTACVTRGTRADVPQKHTGLNWMGEIPSHWVVTRLRHVAPQVTVGIVVTPARYYVDEGVPCLRSFNIRPNRIVDRDLAYISPESNELHRKSIVRKGDLVAVRTGKPGTAAVIDERFDGGNVVDLIIVRQSPTYDSRFLCYFMNSSVAHFQYGAGSEGALQQHFNVETAKDLFIPLPPLEEQREVADRLDQATSLHENAAATIQAQIDRLREYRQTLISAAVTGQINIRREVEVPA